MPCLPQKVSEEPSTSWKLAWICQALVLSSGAGGATAAVAAAVVLVCAGAAGAAVAVPAAAAAAAAAAAIMAAMAMIPARMESPFTEQCERVTAARRGTTRHDGPALVRCAPSIACPCCVVATS